MTPADLSRRGWTVESGRQHADRCVIAGRVHACGDIRGVIVRATHVAPEDLGHIAEAERRYVAAEMTAFLIHWMTQLACPVLNRPSAGCLGGPGWHAEHWAIMARRVGLAVRPVHRRVGIAPDSLAPAPQGCGGVTVVGDRAFGSFSPVLRGKAVTLARLARTNLVRFTFDENERLCGADPFPRPDEPAVETAVLSMLAER